MSINLKFGDTEVIKDLGKIITSSTRSYTIPGRWVRNQTFDIGKTVPAGTYLVQVQMGSTAGFTGDAFVNLFNFHCGITRANGGNIYDTSAGTFFYTISSDITSTSIELYSNANITVNVTLKFIRIV